MNSCVNDLKKLTRKPTALTRFVEMLNVFTFDFVVLHPDYSNTLSAARVQPREEHTGPCSVCRHC